MLVPVAACLAIAPVAVATKPQPKVLALQLWSLPTSWVSAFSENVNQPLGTNGWETGYQAKGSTGPVVIVSTVVLYPSPAQAEAGFRAATVPGSKLVSKAGGLPTADSRIYDDLRGGRDEWTVVWRTTRVVATVSFDAAYVGKLANFQNAGALSTREQKWLVAGGM